MALCRREQLPCEWTLSGSPLQSLAKDIVPRGLLNTKQLDKDCLTLFTDLQHMVTCAKVTVTSSGAKITKQSMAEPRDMGWKQHRCHLQQQSMIGVPDVKCHSADQSPTQILCKTSSYLYLRTSCTKLLFLESVHDIQTQILAKRSILLNVTHAQQITQQRSSAKHLHFIPAQKPHQIVPQNLHMKSKYRYRQKINSLGPAKTGRKFLSPLKTNRHYSENWKHVWWQPLLERKVQDVSVCWSQQNFVSQISSQL